MKPYPVVIAFLSLAFLVGGSAAEAPKANPQSEGQFLALINEVRAQQVAIAENQTKIEVKLAAIAEAARVARIYSSRGGGR